MINVEKLMKSANYDDLTGKRKDLRKARSIIQKQINRLAKRQHSAIQKHNRKMKKFTKKVGKLLMQIDYLDDMGIH